MTVDGSSDCNCLNVMYNRFSGMRKNVHDMTKGKTLTTWVQGWVEVDSTHLAEDLVEGSSSPSTLKEDFQVEAGDLADSIFDLHGIINLHSSHCCCKGCIA